MQQATHKTTATWKHVNKNTHTNHLTTDGNKKNTHSESRQKRKQRSPASHTRPVTLKGEILPVLPSDSPVTLKVGQGQQTSIRSKTVLVVFLNHYPCYRYRSNFEKLFEMAMQQYKLRTLPGAPAIKRPIHKQNREVGGRRRKARADSQKPKKNPQTKHKNQLRFEYSSFLLLFGDKETASLWLASTCTNTKTKSVTTPHASPSC